MERWEELYNESVDTIKFRQAGGMYNDIARKAFKTGFESGVEYQRLLGNVCYPILHEGEEESGGIIYTESAPVSDEAWEKLGQDIQEGKDGKN